MLKFRETASFRDGRPKDVREKEFTNKASFLKTLKSSPISSRVIYDLAKYNESYLMYEDATVHLEIIEDSDSFKIIDGEDSVKSSNAEGNRAKA